MEVKGKMKVILLLIPIFLLFSLLFVDGKDIRIVGNNILSINTTTSTTIISGGGSGEINNGTTRLLNTSSQQLIITRNLVGESFQNITIEFNQTNLTKSFPFNYNQTGLGSNQSSTDLTNSYSIYWINQTSTIFGWISKWFLSVSGFDAGNITTGIINNDRLNVTNLTLSYGGSSGLNESGNYLQSNSSTMRQISLLNESSTYLQINASTMTGFGANESPSYVQGNSSTYKILARLNESGSYSPVQFGNETSQYLQGNSSTYKKISLLNESGNYPQGNSSLYKQLALLNESSTYLQINASTMAGFGNESPSYVQGNSSTYKQISLQNESASYSPIKFGYNMTSLLLSLTNTWTTVQTFLVTSIFGNVTITGNFTNFGNTTLQNLTIMDLKTCTIKTDANGVTYCGTDLGGGLNESGSYLQGNSSTYRQISLQNESSLYLQFNKSTVAYALTNESGSLLQANSSSFVILARLNESSLYVQGNSSTYKQLALLNESAWYIQINASTLARLNMAYNHTIAIPTVAQTWTASQTFTPTQSTSVWTYNSNITLNANLTFNNIENGISFNSGAGRIRDNGSCLLLTRGTGTIAIC